MTAACISRNLLTLLLSICVKSHCFHRMPITIEMSASVLKSVGCAQRDRMAGHWCVSQDQTILLHTTDVCSVTRVAAWPSFGGYAEYLYLPESRLIPVPSSLDPAEAAPVVLNYLTAYQVCTCRASAETSPHPPSDRPIFQEQIQVFLRAGKNSLGSDQAH